MTELAMNKPNWEDAPAWANFVAQDHDNTWWWYETKPTYDDYGSWETVTGDVEIVIFPIDTLNTLEKRP